jgi:hypothetical protein
MPVEEITLGLPNSAPAEESSELPGLIGSGLIRQYRHIRSDRERFAWTRRQRERREAEFDVATRNIVKQLARKLTADITHRRTRVLVRAEIYASVNALLSAASDHRSLKPDRVQVRNRVILIAAATVLLFSVVSLTQM